MQGSLSFASSRGELNLSRSMCLHPAYGGARNRRSWIFLHWLCCYIYRYKLLGIGRGPCSALLGICYLCKFVKRCIIGVLRLLAYHIFGNIAMPRYGGHLSMSGKTMAMMISSQKMGLVLVPKGEEKYCIKRIALPRVMDFSHCMT